MSRKKVPIICVVGWSESGKTSFLEELIGAAIKKGLKVAAIKHTHHEIEENKKDTFRLRKAGADPVLLVSRDLLMITKRKKEDYPLERIVKGYLSGVDIVFAEGFKSAKCPKIEVYSGKGEPLFLKDSDIFALVTEMKVEVDLPTFSPGEAEKTIDFIIRKFSLAP
jgi:molybdopterin-guanine dinucleotide biosynthesis protein MobB